MPPYHSKQTSEGVRVIGKMPLLGFKPSKSKGPIQTGPQEDIIDEALAYFKANILFRTYEIDNDTDRLIVYLTLYISQCLNKCTKKTKAEADKILYTQHLEKFPLPGDNNFVLGGFVSKPSAQEAEPLRQYLTQLRQELGYRLLDKVYANDEKNPDKWWMCFSKRKFLNMDMESK